jgi:hypothetical protein
VIFHHGEYLLTMAQIHALQSLHESFAKDALQCFKDSGDVVSQGAAHHLDHGFSSAYICIARTYVYLSVFYLHSGQAQKGVAICDDALWKRRSPGW